MPNKTISGIFRRRDNSKDGRGQGDRAGQEPGGSSTQAQSTVRSDSLKTQDASSRDTNLVTASTASLAGRLWNQAYEAIRTDDESLVQNFERVVSQNFNVAVTGAESGKQEQDSSARQAQLHRGIQAGLEKLEKEARREENVDKTLNIILKAKDFVNQALQAVPHAALAWSGVCLVLQILVNPSTAAKSNREGIEYVVDRMDWYLNLTNVLLKEVKEETGIETESLRRELEKRIINLYKAILSYQMASVCSYYRNRGYEFLRNALLLNDWDSSLADIRKLEAVFDQDSTQYSTHQAVSLLRRIAIATENGQATPPAPTAPNERESASRPRDIPWVVPFGRNRDFVGREEIIKQLLEIVSPTVDKEACQWTAIEGLGGIGKTQVALEVAHQIRESHNCAVFWVSAVDVNSFEGAYRKIGRQLKIQGLDEEGADVKLLVNSALSELEDDWLLVIDNFDDLDLFGSNTNPTPLHDCLPFSHNGSILFTTRDHKVVSRLDIPLKNVIILSEMSRSEAEDLLKQKLTAQQMSSAQDTSDLLETLAYLPLAIRQASAYMAETGATVLKYLNHCRSSDEALIELLSKDFGDRTRYKCTLNPVAKTWLISFERISQQDNMACAYLQHMCFLAERDIPECLIPQGKNNPIATEESLGVLKAYAFITERQGQESYDMHRLVRLATRNWLVKENRIESTITAVIRVLCEVAWILEQEYPETRQFLLRYLPHAMKALEYQTSSADYPTLALLLSKVGNIQCIFGHFQSAEDLLRQALELATKDEVFGPNHSDTWIIKADLACMLDERGESLEAALILQEVLPLFIEKFGSEDPLTLQIMASLARALRRLGNYQEAITMHKEVLALRTKRLGPEHYDTISSMDDLASTFYKQERYEDAATISRQALALCRKLLIFRDPLTTRVMNNFGLTLQNQGNSDEVVAMLREVVTVQTENLGSEHHHTIIGMNNLASALLDQGSYQEAAKLYGEAYVLSLKVLGPEHPTTLLIKGNFSIFEGWDEVVF